LRERVETIREWVAGLLDALSSSLTVPRLRRYSRSDIRAHDKSTRRTHLAETSLNFQSRVAAITCAGGAPLLRSLSLLSAVLPSGMAWFLETPQAEMRAKGPVPQFSGRRTMVSTAPPSVTSLQSWAGSSATQTRRTSLEPEDQSAGQSRSSQDAAAVMSERICELSAVYT
jgi:hypothetical protein